MGDHPLLPPIQDTFPRGDVEAQVLAVARRFPALCKLLATLVTASPPKSQDAEVRPGGWGTATVGVGLIDIGPGLVGVGLGLGLEAVGLELAFVRFGVGGALRLLRLGLL